MTQETEVPKRERVSKGRNLMRGGTPSSSLLENGVTDPDAEEPYGSESRKRRNFERGRAVYTDQGSRGKTLKRKKAKRGANVRSG